jgi:hypothetical protein
VAKGQWTQQPLNRHIQRITAAYSMPHCNASASFCDGVWRTYVRRDFRLSRPARGQEGGQSCDDTRQITRVSTRSPASERSPRSTTAATKNGSGTLNKSPPRWPIDDYRPTDETTGKPVAFPRAFDTLGQPNMQPDRRHTQTGPGRTPLNPGPEPKAETRIARRHSVSPLNDLNTPITVTHHNPPEPIRTKGFQLPGSQMATFCSKPEYVNTRMEYQSEEICAPSIPHKTGSRYASLDRCAREVETAEPLFRTGHVPVLDSTVRSIEEIAANILEHADLARRLN